MTSPYSRLPRSSFWRAAISDRHVADYEDIWQPISIKKTDKIATAGSCFAQHIGRNLKARGANFMDYEPAPSIIPNVEEARRWGYSTFSCRYGNVYTTRQLLQLFDEAFEGRVPDERVWEKNGRFFDALRPSVDPVGHSHRDDVIALRERHLDAVRKMFEDLDVFIFTLGLTEGWEAVSDGTMFATAPGTVAGTFDESNYKFRNLRYPDIRSDMDKLIDKVRLVNKTARLLLTVSPVPLVATASGSHVLPATTYSKSVLRAVAGDLAEDYHHVAYFPSYEIVASHPTRGMFFDQNLRTVNHFGVEYVMSHFFSGKLGQTFGVGSEGGDDGDLLCDEEALEKFS